MIWAILVSVMVWAQHPDPSRPQLGELVTQGKLVTLRLVTDEKAAKLYLVGKEAAKIQIGKDASILQITAFGPSQEEQNLKFKAAGDSYILENLPEWKHEYELKVKAKKGKQEEELRFRMSPR